VGCCGEWSGWGLCGGERLKRAMVDGCSRVVSPAKHMKSL
jgi:hypothetical protein